MTIDLIFVRDSYSGKARFFDRPGGGTWCVPKSQIAGGKPLDGGKLWRVNIKDWWLRKKLGRFDAVCECGHVHAFPVGSIAREMKLQCHCGAQVESQKIRI